MAEAKPVVLLDGRVFHGRYEIVRCLRASGMGAVYEVLDRRSRRRRALKVMRTDALADADLRARFKQEATITAEIDSDHIVQTLDADIDAETEMPFVVMELLKGEDLGAMLARRGALPAGEVIGLLYQAALALDRTHAASVVHRDLKPENLFVTISDDGSARLKVLDFGIAKVIAGSGAPLQTTRALGTPLYMPPEQIRGDGGIGPPADVYALGHVAYAMLVGEPYWSEEGAATTALYAIFNRILGGVREPPTARARRRSGVTLPPAFDGWFARATAPKPGARFASASELVAALAGVLDQSLPRPFRIASEPPRDEAAPRASVSSQPATGSTTAAAVASRHVSRAAGWSMLPWLAGASLLVAGAGGLFLSLRGRATASAVGCDLGGVAAGVTAALASAPVEVPAPVTSRAEALVTPPPATQAPPAPSVDAVRAVPAPAPTRGQPSGSAARGASIAAPPAVTHPPVVAPPAARPAASGKSGGYDPTDVR